jgi:predicted transcriptional regulator
LPVSDWAFLSKHSYALLCIARDPDSRLRDVADTLGITERAAYSLVKQLVEGGYLKKTKRGSRNRYEVQREAPMRHPLVRHETIGHLLDAVGPDVESPRRRERH